MASQQNDASPPAPSRCARAERLLASIDSRVDRDTVKIVKQHLRACMLKYEREGVPTPPDDPVLAAFDAFGTTGGGDEAALLGALETYVHTVLGRSEDVGIGSPLVVSASLHSLLENAGLDDHDVGSMRPASPARRITVNADGQGHARLTGRLARLGSASLADLFSPSHMPIPVHLVYFAEEMRSVALELAAHTDAVVLREIDWGSFPDGFPNLRVNHAKDLRFNSVLFLASIHSPASLLSQISIIYALPGYGAKRVKVIIPWFATGTMERESVRGEVATAKTLARLLSATPLSATGPVQFSILDIHALQEQFYFADTVQIRLKSCIGLLQDALMLQPDVGEISIVFPDEGAMKRFGGKLLTFGDPIVCSKRRGPDGKRTIVITDGEPAGRHCVIVDDLVQSGGTILEAAAALLERGAACVSAYCTHAVFPAESWRKFMPATGAAAAVGATTAPATAAAAAAGAITAPATAAATTATSATVPAVGSDSSVPAVAVAARPRPPTALRHFWVTNSIPTMAATLRAAGAPFEVLSICSVVEDIIGL